MKKLELHMDALIAMFAVLALVIAFLVFQRYQYSNLLQENVDLLWENSTLEANLVFMTTQIDKCKSSLDSMEKSGVESKLANSPD